MPSYNQAEFVGRSIDSVLTQNYPNIELIIADGGSTDSTLEVLARKSEQYDGLYWVSEPDQGPGDAINKALSRVRGEIIGWLNSDDLYTQGAIRRSVEAFQQNSDWILCYGHGEHIDADDHIIGAYPTRHPSVGLEGFINGCFICQPTIAFKTPILTLLGNLDEAQKTSFDYEYWLRAFSALPERIGFVDAVQAQSRLHDACITLNMRRTVAVEGVRLSHQYLGRGAIHWVTTYLEDIRPEMNRNQFKQHTKDLLNELETCLEAKQLQNLKSSILVAT